MDTSRHAALWAWFCLLFFLSNHGGDVGYGGNGSGAVLLASAQITDPSAASVASVAANDSILSSSPSQTAPASLSATPTIPTAPASLSSTPSPSTIPTTSPSTTPTVPTTPASPLSTPPVATPTRSSTSPPSPTPPASLSTTPATSKGVGVNIGFGYSTTQINASETVAILKKISAVSVKLFGDFVDTPAGVAFIDALAGTGIDVVIPVSSSQIATLASDYNASRDFVQTKVKARLDLSVNISTIAVGNEVLLPDYGTAYWATIVPAMVNVHKALQEFALDQTIKVVTPLNFNCLSNTYPPSSGVFNQSYTVTIKPLLQFLNETGSPFMVNIYPFYPTRDPTKNIMVDFALGVPGSKIDTDPGSNLSYTNMVDMMMDALAFAIEKEGFYGIHLAVGEVGWPTDGHQIATVGNGEKFNNYLVGQLMSGKGTPKRPGEDGWMQVYLFELLDEDLKPVRDGNGPFEHHWGICYLNGTAKYPIDLTKGWNATTPPPSTGAPTSPGSASAPSPSSCVPGDRGGNAKSPNQTLALTGGPNTYCVVNDCTADASILVAIDWLCGQTNMSCAATQEAGVCFVPDTPVSHGSYLFNSYYVSQGRRPSACNFEASYYRRFIKGFAAIARPLTNLLRKDQPLIWTSECDQAFSKLKAALISAPVLIRPDPEKPFVLITDWQPEAISAILSQVGPSGLESVVEYASKSVPACKRNYAAPIGECYAALWGISHFRAYLYGRKFTLVTDHEPLLALKKSKDYSGMIARWATVLQSMDFDIRHWKHERHGNADGLRRLHRPEKVLKSEEVIPWNEPEQKIGPRYGQVEILLKQTSHVTTAAGFTGDISLVNPQRHTAILASLREWTEQVSNVWQHVLAREGYNIIPISASDLDGIRRALRERPVTFEELSFCLTRVQVKWTGTIEHPTWIENPELLIVQGWRTNGEGDLIGFLFGSVQPGRRRLIAQELIAPIVQLADDLSPDIYFQSDNSPAPYIFERSLDPYLQWTSCFEELRDEDTLPSRQEYLKPYEVIPYAFYPRAEEVVINDDEEEDNDEDVGGGKP
ncbi:hypothetical protein CBR_g8218 [Chara braunii]|uniref:X8 domain-containing protein n=1 Tax=Chara braunii TaxID=69332 RepID=A0A388KLK4_CHABU|nr:hypothetical protein CBR_g8218 [Chara braunii]|eukprot:GBG70917.1 hypothetical protein CBR_g8218 [Chara braunii]